ncbi:MAG: hypothetical protein R3B72_47835 [Polyangiaceae bacterium]
MSSLRWSQIFAVTALLVGACAVKSKVVPDDDGGTGGAAATGTGGAATSSSSTTSSSSSATTGSTGSGGASSSGGGGAGGAGGMGVGGAGGQPTCYESAACDPLVPGDCDAAEGPDSACDLSMGGVLTCYGGPNPQQEGQSCNSSSYCAHGLTCISGTCHAFCCSDNECTTGSCTPISGASNAFACQ